MLRLFWIRVCLIAYVKAHKDKVSYATGFTPPPDAKSTTAESK